MSHAAGSWGEWPDGGDPIGTASARLLALGVERMARLAALRFLGLLLDHADDEGRVRFDPDVLAAEFCVRQDDARLFLSWLEAADVVVTDHAGRGLLVRGAAGRRQDGLREGVAMAVLTDVLRPVHEEAVREHQPVPPAPPAAAPARPLVIPDAAPEPVRRRPALAGVAMVVGLLLIAAGLVTRPGGGPDREQLAAGSSRDATTIVGPSAPAAGPLRGTTLDGSADEEGDAERRTEETGPSAAYDDSADTGLVAEPRCPAQVPALGPVDAVVVAASEQLAGAVPVPAWNVVVRGAVTGGAAAAVVEEITVRITIAGGVVLVGDAVRTPLHAGAAESSAWETTIPAGQTAPELVSATAELTEWRWADPDLASACA